MKIPVAFFIYNRPQKTRRTFSAIQEYKPEVLYIIADGPKNTLDKPLVDETRQVVENIDWHCKLRLIYADENLTCGQRIASGLNEVFAECDQAIIIEDDILVCPAFFAYCSAMLTRLEEDTTVMAVCGWNGLMQYEQDKFSAFYSKTVKLWGWATWRRAWKKFNINPQWPTDFVEEALGQYFTHAFEKKLNSHVYKNKLWKTDPWGFPWAMTIYLNHAFVITPTVNLTQNIGFDVEGTNMNKFDLRSLISIDSSSHFFSDKTVKKEYDYNSQWYDHSMSLLSIFCMFEDARKMLFIYKTPQLIPKDQSKTGWECQLQPFIEAAHCVQLLLMLDRRIDSPAIRKMKQVFEKAISTHANINNYYLPQFN